MNVVFEYKRRFRTGKESGASIWSRLLDGSEPDHWSLSVLQPTELGWMLNASEVSQTPGDEKGDGARLCSTFQARVASKQKEEAKNVFHAEAQYSELDELAVEQASSAAPVSGPAERTDRPSVQLDVEACEESETMPAGQVTSYRKRRRAAITGPRLEECWR